MHLFFLHLLDDRSFKIHLDYNGGMLFPLSLFLCILYISLFKVLPGFPTRGEEAGCIRKRK